MQRLLYPVLLVSASTLATAVYLRPSVGEELLAMIGSCTGIDTARGESPTPSLTGTGALGAPQYPPQPPSVTVRPVSWPAAPAEPGYDRGAELAAPDAGFQSPTARGPAPPGYGWAEEQPATEPWTPGRDRRPASERWAPPEDHGTPAEPWPPRDDDRLRDPSAGGRARTGGAPVESGRGLPPARTARIPVREVVPEDPTVDPEDDIARGAVPCECAQIVARVGAHAVLASDVWIAAEQYQVLANAKNQLPPELVKQQRKALIEHNFRQLLAQMVETRLAYYDAVSTIPPEGLKNAEEQLGKYFEKEELPRLMELWGVDSQRELDQTLMSMGTSVHRHKQAFIERALAQQWIRQSVKIDEDVNHEQMLAYYQEHQSDFEHRARARWEQIMVRTSSYPSKEAARAALARMGNEVMDGRPFAEVARNGSEGPAATQGGTRDWTTKGSLVSEVLDRAIFGLPVGQLSPILEGGDSLHIIRVLERKDAERTPFTDAQVKIREEIRQQRNRVQQQAYLDRLRDRVPVWTIFDGKSAGADGAE